MPQDKISSGAEDYKSIRPRLLTDDFVSDITDVYSISGPDRFREQFNGNIAGVSNNFMFEKGYVNKPPFSRSNSMLSIYDYDQLYRLKNTRNITSFSGNKFGNQFIPNNGLGMSLTYDQNGNIQNLLRTTLDASKERGAPMDDLTYNYIPNTNKLTNVVDSDTQSTTKGDIKHGQKPKNYLYDLNGNLTRDSIEEIKEIKLNAYGKIASVERIPGSVREDVSFTYDVFGRRLSKIVKPKNNLGALLPKNQWTYYYYQYDASGNLMASYDVKFPTTTTAELRLEEFSIYGTGRVGVEYSKNSLLSQKTFSLTNNTFSNVQCSASLTMKNTDRLLGTKKYELTNHLGSVNVVFSDRKFLTDDKTHFEIEQLSRMDFYAFGQQIESKTWSSSSYNYNFAYQGMNQEVNVLGGGNLYSTEFRMYDPRLGKWMSLDPLMEQFPWMSPFVGFDNNPILYIDPYGLNTIEKDTPAEPVGGGGDNGDGIDSPKDGMVGGTKAPMGAPENPTNGQTFTNKNGTNYSFNSKSGSWQLELEDVVVTPTKKNDSYEGLKGTNLSGFNFGGGTSNVVGSLLIFFSLSVF